MPVSEVDLTNKKFSFLKPLVDGRNQIVNNYSSVIDNEHISNFHFDHWKLMLLYTAENGNQKDTPNFPIIEKFINELPENIALSTVTISNLKFGDTAFHNEKWTKEDGFCRIQIPLHNFEGSSIFVVEDDGQIIEYFYELDNAYEFENPYNMHKPIHNGKDKSSRLMMLLDFVDTNENPNLSEESLFDFHRRGGPQWHTYEGWLKEENR